jgi:isoleucyl-tRNA synthetase
VTYELENLHPHQAARALQNFWLNELSRGYIQIVRDRIAENDEEVKFVLARVFIDLLKLTAPIIPFVTEKLWQEMRQKKIVDLESVHLSEWPKADGKKIDKKLENEFDCVLNILEVGLAERDKAKIGLRWPLASAEIAVPAKLKKFEEVIKSQLNVKKIIWRKGNENECKIVLNTKRTPELEAEGFSRELARKVQAERKNAGLKKGQLITLKIVCSGALQEMFNNNIKFLKERTNSKKIDFSDGEMQNKQNSFKIKDEKISISFS